MTLLVVFALGVSAYLLLSKEVTEPVAACIWCTQGTGSHCVGDCTPCDCPLDPPGNMGCICGSCSAVCDDGYESDAGGSFSECACHNSGCGGVCGNDETCRKVCTDSCPDANDTCHVSCPDGWMEGTQSDWSSNCESQPSCDGTSYWCDPCHDEKECYRPEPSTQPAPTAHMLYCYSGQSDSCVELSTSISAPTEVYPPQPSAGAFIGMEEVIAPANPQGMYYDIYYDMGLENVTTSSELYDYTGWSDIPFDNVTSLVSSGNVYHVKGKDASDPYCYEGNLWCAGDPDPYNGEGPCTEVHGYFKPSYPPSVSIVSSSVEVVEDHWLTCNLPSGPISRWTGSRSYGHIIVDVVANPSSAPGSVTFSTTGYGYYPFTLAGSTLPNDQVLLSGYYVVQEATLPPGWTRTQVRCLDGSTTITNVSPAQINLVGGHTVVCTYTYSYTPVSPLYSNSAEDTSMALSSNESPLPVVVAEALTTDENENSAVLAAIAPAGVNNPISIKVTVYDADGYQDIDSVYLDIAPAGKTGNQLDYFCTSEQTQYFSVELMRGLLSRGWKSAIKTQVVSSDCTPSGGSCNSYPDQSSCSSAGCYWDEESYLESCRCDPGSFNPANPVYSYDGPSCQQRIPPGTNSNCHSCYSMTDHPNYKILEFQENVIDDYTVSYTFTVLFKSSYPESRNTGGVQQFYVMARSGLLFSGDGDGGYQPHRYTVANNDQWKWGFDFTIPAGSISVHHPSNTPANTVQITNTVSDDLSGARFVYNRAWWIDRPGIGNMGGGSLPDQMFNLTAASYTAVMTDSTTSTFAIPDASLDGGDIVRSSDIREDIACNDNSSTTGFGTVGPRWIQTFWGSVYGYQGFDDPIPLNATALSQYWIGGVPPTGNFGSGDASAQLPVWFSTGYDDDNRNAVRIASSMVSWYDEMYNLATNSEWTQTHQNGALYEIVTNPAAPAFDISSILNSGEEGIYFSDGGSPLLTVATSTRCVGRKIVFVPSGVELLIEPDLINDTEESACLFIVNDGLITIGEGSDKSNPMGDVMLDLTAADRIDAAFITDMKLNVAYDNSFPRPDRLEIFGFVFSNEANFGRDMLWEDNAERPTVRISYDSRFLDLFRDMVGRRPYSEYECGLVKGSEACGGWVDQEIL